MCGGGLRGRTIPLTAWLLEVCPALAPFTVTSLTPFMQLVTFQLLPWFWIPERVEVSSNICRPFKWSLLKIWQFLLPPQPPLVFIARIYKDLSSWCWNPGLCGLAWGLGSFAPEVSLLIFIFDECGTAHSDASPRYTTSPHLLPVWMNVASLNPWLLDFHAALFSDGSGCYCFGV